MLQKNANIDSYWYKEDKYKFFYKTIWKLIIKSYNISREILPLSMEFKKKKKIYIVALKRNDKVTINNKIFENGQWYKLLILEMNLPSIKNKYLFTKNNFFQNFF